MKKRLFSLLLAMLMLATLLCACGGTSPEDGSQTDASNSMANAFFQEDPADDGVLRILAIGNSFCYYFTDELYGMLKEAGIEAVVTNAYYSGCRLEQHWNWLNDGSAKYQFITVSSSGKQTLDDFTLEAGMKLQNWDVITLQQHYNPDVAADLEEAQASCEPYAEKLYGYLAEKFPCAELLWHHTWAYQVGYQGPVGKDPDTIDEAAKVLTVEKQTLTYENIRSTALKVCEDNGVGRIPGGDAWQLARANAAVGDNLCARLAVNAGEGDYYHDGDIGGGQYLNACVWFEVLTGKSCVGNAFRPSYELSEEKIAALQEAAHQAVANMAAENA